MPPPSDALDRFVAAQAADYSIALAELTAGRKRSHWMWYIFPQIAGLGRSPTAQHYAIRDLAEAQDYLAHPLLGPRYRAAAAALLPHRARSAEAIMGVVDAVKLRSSLTLFTRAGAGAGAEAEAALAAFFPGPDPATLRLLDGSRS